MVLVHGIFWSWTSGGALQIPPDSLMFRLMKIGTVLGLLPMMLPTLAGAALAHRLGASSLRADRRSAAIVSVTGVFLVACGVLTNVLAGGWHVARAWNVLQFAGLSFQLIAICLLLRSEIALGATGLIALVVASPLRTAFLEDSPPMWKAILLGDPTDYHAWALLPWYPTIVAGWFLARSRDSARDPRTFSRRLALVAGAAIVIVTPFGGLRVPFDAKNLIGPAFMVPEPPRIIATAAFAALLIAAATYFRSAPFSNPAAFVRVWSGGILPIYIIHMAVGNQLAMRLLWRLDREKLWEHPFAAATSIRLWALPLFLLVLSWGVAWVSVRLFHDRRVVVRLRRAASPSV